MKINITLDLPPEQIWSMICGSGWETWSWWYGLKYDGGDWDKPCDLWIICDNPYGDDDASGSDDALCALVTLPDLIRAIEELSIHEAVMNCLHSDDFDAAWGDVVMQQAVYGEVVYG